jgi:hypothetical protein
VVEEDKVDEEVDTIEEKIEGGSSLEQRVGVVTRFEWIREQRKTCEERK